MLVEVTLSPYQLISANILSSAAVFGCLSKELTQAVFTGRLAHREDEGSQLHSFLHAWGHAPKGERVHHERVQIWRKVNAPDSIA